MQQPKKRVCYYYDSKYWENRRENLWKCTSRLSSVQTESEIERGLRVHTFSDIISVFYLDRHGLFISSFALHRFVNVTKRDYVLMLCIKICILTFDNTIFAFKPIDSQLHFARVSAMLPVQRIFDINHSWLSHLNHNSSIT